MYTIEEWWHTCKRQSLLAEKHRDARCFDPPIIEGDIFSVKLMEKVIKKREAKIEAFYKKWGTEDDRYHVDCFLEKLIEDDSGKPKKERHDKEKEKHRGQ